MVFGAMLSRLLLLAFCFLISVPPGVKAQDVAEFYRGKTLNIVLGVAPGGGYDQNARLVSRVIGKYIPGNPQVIVQYLGTANSLPAANHVYNIAPKDGTAIWAGTRLAPYEPLWGNSNAKFDVTKLRWLGSTASDNGVVVVWHTAPHKTAEDLFKTELVTGATAPGGDTYLYPNALNKLIGTKFKLVSGYPNQAPIALAMERGEVEGSGNWSWSSIGLAYPQWITEKKVRILMQLGLEKHRDLPDVPLVMDYAKTDEQREILRILMGMKKFSYPFFIPPGVPKDRADALDQAFQKMLKDPEFVAEAKQQNRDAGSATGAEMTEVINRAYALPPAIIEKARDIVSPN
jgi:tripartite-type tricarboxylate transporter receptor subunit TctC